MSAPMCLITMPWQSLESPSLPLGLLKSAAVAAGLPEPDGYHANLRWAEFLLERTDGEVGPPEYTEIAEEGLFDSLGDWVFAGVLHDDPDFGVDTLRGYASERGISIDLVERMRVHAADFVDLVVAEVLDRFPSAVGFTSTFMQNAPSLAAARLLKRRAPDLPVVFGGGNCDGPMGAAIHRNYPFVDFVVRGEGEVAFPRLLAALDQGGGFDQVPGLCWRDGEGAQRVNEAPPPLPAARIPVPAFADWYAHLDESPVNEYIEPKLVMETARGCWWGEKHHCTFCGLNGTLMAFRAKEADAALAELTDLVTRHRTLDVIVVDNIIDSSYYRDLLPRVADLGWDVRLHYELKSNLRPEEIAVLHAAHVTHVQPGIESLVSPVLKVMDKGVSGTRNVRTLRDCESVGLTVSWNWLYGFPGERADQYAPVVRQIPALVHLQPPASASRILLERFSPYFENPALGFADRTTARAYRHVYALAEDDLRDMVYLFDATPAGLSDVDAKPLRDMLDLWERRYTDSSLVRHDDGETVVLRDRRVGWPAEDHRIEPGMRDVYLDLEHGRSLTGLLRQLESRGNPLGEGELRSWLAGLAERGLVMEEDGQWITLATTSAPIKVG